MMNIELQLELTKMRSGKNEEFETCLLSIRKSIRRMANTVESLKHIKRIVLTDYLAGTKMLDLKRSTQADATQTQADS